MSFKYSRQCPHCQSVFQTNYHNKKYCGAESCEQARRRVKNKRAEAKRQSHPQYRDYLKQKYQRRRELELARARQRYWRERGIKLDLELPALKDPISHEERSSQRYSQEQVQAFFADAGYKVVGEYKNFSTAVPVICPDGHCISMPLSSFLKGHRCRECSRPFLTSRAEEEISSFLTAYDSSLVIERNCQLFTGSRLEVDLYFPHHNVAVEYCGLYWHSEDQLRYRLPSLKAVRKYHRLKAEKCWELGIHLLTVFEDEYLYKREVVLSRILHSLNLSPIRYYARQLQVRELTFSQSCSFFSENHLQGNSVAKKAWGLYSGDVLVAAVSVGATGRAHAGGSVPTLEIKRYASLPFTLVVGGFSKLLKVVKDYALHEGYSRIVSYADMRYTKPVDPVYIKAGFTKVRETSYTPHYVKNRRRYRNQSLRRSKEHRELGISEWDVRRREGYLRIWDCGHQTFQLDL